MKSLENDYEKALSSNINRRRPFREDPAEVNQKLTMIVKHYLPHLIDSDGKIVGKSVATTPSGNLLSPNQKVQQAQEMWLQSLTPNLAVEPRNRRFSDRRMSKAMGLQSLSLNPAVEPRPRRLSDRRMSKDIWPLSRTQTYTSKPDPKMSGSLVYKDIYGTPW